jgi:hypothetical protein
MLSKSWMMMTKFAVVIATTSVFMLGALRGVDAKCVGVYNVA